jgi:hypothetical protein
MRLLLSDIIAQSLGEKTSTGGNFIPDIYKVDINNWDDRVKNLPWRIIKTHEPYDEKYGRIIYIFRNPCDTFYSYHNYVQQHNPKPNLDLDKFCLEKVDEWVSHVESYLTLQQQKPEQIRFLSYESLHKNNQFALKMVAKFIGLKINSLTLKTAVENQKFNRLQEVSKQEDLIESTNRLGFWENKGYQDFFYQGKINYAQNKLLFTTVKMIETKTEQVYQKAQSLDVLNMKNMDILTKGDFFLSRMFLYQKLLN